MHNTFIVLYQYKNAKIDITVKEKVYISYN